MHILHSYPCWALKMASIHRGQLAGTLTMNHLLHLDQALVHTRTTGPDRVSACTGKDQ